MTEHEPLQDTMPPVTTPLAVVIVDEYNNLHSWSLGAERLFGSHLDDASNGMRFDTLAAEGVEQEIIQNLNDARRRGDLNCSMVLVDRQRHPRSLMGTIAPLMTADSRGHLVITLQEATPHTRFDFFGCPIAASLAGDDILESAWQTLLETFPLPLVAIDDDARLMRWSTAAGHLLGWREEEVLGKPIRDFFEPRETDLTLIDPRETVRQEHLARTKAGAQLPVVLTVAPLPDEDSGPSATVILIEDISQRRLIERTFLNTAAEEQQCLGRQLEDQLCQELAGAAFVAQAYSQDLARQSFERAPQLADLAILLDRAVRQALGIARNPNPVHLSNEGLMSALEELAHRTDPTVSCVFICPEKVMIPQTATSLHLFRLANEAVSNAVHYARPSAIRILLEKHRNAICLQIVDDGKHADDGNTETRNLNARLMDYRARAAGGFCEVRHSSKGTSVRFTLPLET